MLNCTLWYDVDSCVCPRNNFRLRGFENSLLRRMFVPKRVEIKGGLEAFHNEELQNLSYIGAIYYYEIISIINLSVKSNA
jgi:hypothetical protein